MRKLTTEERIDEIARMLSGATKTAAAVENAKVMLDMGNADDAD
jgi:DNA repair ATPase RecN